MHGSSEALGKYTIILSIFRVFHLKYPSHEFLYTCRPRGIAGRRSGLWRDICIMIITGR